MTTEPVREPAPVESGGDIAPPAENPILGEIDRLNSQGDAQLPVNEAVTEEAPQTETPAVTPDATPVAEQAPVTGDTPTTGQAPAPEAAPQQPQQPQVPYTPEQVQKMQQEARQYQEVQARAALQNQTNAYRQQLETQGFLPEHAQQAAEHYMQSQQQQQNLMQQAENYRQHLEGKSLASEVMVKKYKLGIDDLTELRMYEDPQSMENAAKKLAADRERDDELSRLRQAQVPPQQFDNSQGEPSVAANDGSWLDRYNAGDRYPNAVSAARRATGLG